MQVLLLGGLLIFSFNSFAKKEVISDVLVYMIKDQVYSLEDLTLTQRALKDFKCMYPDSFIVDYFNLIALKFDKRVFDKNKLEENYKTKKFDVYLKEMLKYHKMTVYTKEQSVNVNNELKKAIILSAKSRNCGQEFINGVELSEQLHDALALEVFFRSRNVLANSEEASTNRKKIIKSLDSLANSITNQINHTQFEVIYNKD
jgi:hypothetical protein